ncbi:hypothetical protein EQ500_01265, partial [Lactobacillus sp. XV13L]|nr:hypothetical protein [Lactobacillus sp. XV13L]
MMDLKRLLESLAAILAIMTLAACKKAQPLNRQVTASTADWYLYQGAGSGQGNLLQLHFYNNQTVSVKSIANFNQKNGTNILNADFANPTYRLN